MDRQLWMVICGITALVLYSLSWIFRLMHWPGAEYVRISALLPFLIGGSIWLYDWSRKRKAQGRSKKATSGWEDILDEEEENS